MLIASARLNYAATIGLAVRDKFCALLLVAALVGFVAPASAQNWNCNDPDDLPQQGMNYCMHQDYLKADAALNAEYKRVRNILKTTLTDFPRPDGKTEVEALRDAQRAWIKYRDLACEMEGIAFRGGSMEPLLISACLARLTEQRTNDLGLLVETGAGEK